jgi:hypothetical protein
MGNHLKTNLRNLVQRKIFKKKNLKFTREKRGNLDDPIISEDIEFVLKPSKEETLDLEGFTEEQHKTLDLNSTANHPENRSGEGISMPWLPSPHPSKKPEINKAIDQNRPQICRQNP